MNMTVLIDSLSLSSFFFFFFFFFFYFFSLSCQHQVSQGGGADKDDGCGLPLAIGQYPNHSTANHIESLEPPRHGCRSLKTCVCLELNV
jgi:hypothetical protein